MKQRFIASFLVVVTLSLIFSLVLGGPAQAAAGDIELVSVGPDGVLGNGHSSDRPSISADGRFVAFSSSATNLVEGMTIAGGLYVHDRETDTTELVSVSTGGVKSTGYRPSISADGRYVAFSSQSTTLVTGDTNNLPDLFVRDRVAQTTVRISVSSAGLQANGMSWSPQISADGTRVAFYSEATNLVSGDTNTYPDIFVHELSSKITTRVSIAYDGSQADQYSENPSISADGRYVAYATLATNLVAGVVDTNQSGDIIVRDTLLNTNTLVSVSTAGGVGGGSMDASISADGRFVAFLSSSSDLVEGDTNYYNDIFVRDLQLNTTTRVSVKSDGTQATGGASEYPEISANGRFVTFSSFATNLVDGDTLGYEDIFIHDRLTGETIRASVNTDGIQGNQASWTSSISANGLFVSFTSAASNLVLGDNNGKNDIFVYENGMAVSTCTWTGSAGTNWDNAANWSCNFVPTEIDRVIIPDVTNNPIIAGGVVKVASLTLESNGSLSVLSGATFQAADVLIQANGLLTVDGSTLISNNLEIEESADLHMTDAVLTMAAGEGYLNNHGDLYAHNVSQDGLINGTVDGTGTFINYGTIHIDGDYALNIDIPFNNQGAIEAAGGEIVIDEGSTLSGSGSLTGDLVNAGCVSPGESPAILTIDGDYTQLSTGTLEIELGGTTAGTGYDQLAVTGSAILGGTLRVILLPGFEPQAGQVFDIITYGTGTYEFDTENLPELPGGLVLEVAYSDPGITLTVVSGKSFLFLPLIVK